jgi:pimeloyl-ACP methyl ester carboxylesterase
VRVPLDWARPKGPKITLAVIRYLASGPDQRIGSLFVNFGGPGDSGVDDLRRLGATFDALGQGRFDVVSWDPRGTGASTHVRCFANARSQARFWGSGSIPTTKAAPQRYVAKTVAFARRCAALSGRLLAHVSTADNARDLDYLRGLVGDRQLTYLGLSYGTLLGQTYANMFPRRVRAMILDGVVDAVGGTTGTEAAVADTIADGDLVFAKFQSLCQSAGPARCALAGHGPVAPRVSGLLARLRRGPIPAPSAAPPRQLSYGDLLLDLFEGLPVPGQWPQLAAGLDQAAGGDGSALETAAQQARSAFQSDVAQVALTCADEPPPRQGPQAWPAVIARLTRVSHIFGPVGGWGIWAPCASWPVASANRYTGPWNASTRTPILVTDTLFDPKHRSPTPAAPRADSATRCC